MISDYERKIRTRQAEGHYKHIWAEPRFQIQDTAIRRDDGMIIADPSIVCSDCGLKYDDRT